MVKADLLPYVYLHVPPKKTGDKYKRLLRPVTDVKAFNYKIYKKNSNYYQDSHFRVKLEETDKHKTKCYVLMAADTKKKLQDEIQKKSRFRIPTNTNSMREEIDDGDLTNKESSPVQNENFEQRHQDNDEMDTFFDQESNEVEEEDADTVIQAKRSRKEAKKFKENQKSFREDSILLNYMDQNNTDNDSEKLPNYEESDSSLLNRLTSRYKQNKHSNNINKQHPNNDKQIDSSLLASTSDQNKQTKKNNNVDSSGISAEANIIINELRLQFEDARKAQIEMAEKILELESRAEGTDEVPRNTSTSSSNSDTCRHGQIGCSDEFIVHDKIYGYVSEQNEKELKYDNDGNVIIGLNVKCNPTAYTDAFKKQAPTQCLNLLSQGVFGLDRLSKMCVRKQSNTIGKEVYPDLERIAIEQKVFAYMRGKNFTLHQINHFFNKINDHHAHSIHNAKKRLQHQQKMKEKEMVIEKDLLRYSTQEEES